MTFKGFIDCDTVRKTFFDKFFEKHFCRRNLLHPRHRRRKDQLPHAGPDQRVPQLHLRLHPPVRLPQSHRVPHLGDLLLQ